MSNTAQRSIFIRAVPALLAASAAGMLLFSLKLPLWHMRLEAPQYRDEEALKVAVYPNKYGGDLRELTVLNQYIGVHVPKALPQFTWLPALLAAGAAIGLAGSCLPLRGRRAVMAASCGLIAAGVIAAAVQAKSQMHDIGHKRDHHTVLAGVHDFTPPFLGTSKIAQFTVTSGFGAGAWLIGGALVLQLSAIAISGKRPKGAGAGARTPAPKPQPVPGVEAAQFAYQI